MNREQVLEELEQLVDLLQSLDIDGAALMKKDRLVENIALISRMILTNTLKEGTKALTEATERLSDLSERLENDKEDAEQTAENLQAALGVLGALASVIRFV